MERNKFIKFGVSADEKESFQKHAKESKMSVSEFIRQSIFEKIRRIENPERFSQSISQINPLILESLSKDMKKQIELQELILKRQNQFDEITKTLELIQIYSKGRDLKHETDIIDNLFEAHKSLSQQQIMEKTGFDKDIVWAIVSNQERYRLNITNGKFSKR
ncbi:MAG: DUF6290 family protein [Promethearchaeota archaeon]